ncbi:flippase [Hydrogenimonas urashimensis]|uniref:flippase n=1 Tax=Hydrogenimonas urashimensis TaxID=2740515 RepID=UPI0019157F02|nr:flippase [Hydrogenimonas urashimensis]
MKNSSWLLVEKILRLIIGLFIGIWIARVLGPGEYGNLSYIQSFVALFSAFTTLGISGIVIREIVANPEKSDAILANAFTLRFFGALGTMVLIFVLLRWFAPDSRLENLILLASAGLFFQAFNVLDLYFQSQTLNQYSALANIVMLILSALLKFFLIVYNAPLYAYVWALLFDSAVLAMNLLLFYLKATAKKFSDFLHFFDKVQFSEIALLLRHSAPLLLSTFIIAIYAQLDQVMLKHMADAETVGRYAAAVRLNSVWSLLPSVILVVVTPSLMYSEEKIKESVVSSYASLYKLLALYSFLVLAATWILSDFIVGMTFGEKYRQAASVLNILVIANLFSYFGAASSRWFINEKQEKKILYRNLFGVGFNIIGNLMLIPSFGAYGAAFTTLLSQFLANFLYDYLDKSARIVFFQKLRAMAFVMMPYRWLPEIMQYRNRIA